MVAGKILKREINPQDQQRFVEESLGQLQSMQLEQASVTTRRFQRALTRPSPTPLPDHHAMEPVRRGVRVGGRERVEALGPARGSLEPRSDKTFNEFLASRVIGAAEECSRRSWATRIDNFSSGSSWFQPQGSPRHIVAIAAAYDQVVQQFGRVRLMSSPRARSTRVSSPVCDRLGKALAREAVVTPTPEPATMIGGVKFGSRSAHRRERADELRKIKDQLGTQGDAAVRREDRSHC